MKRILLAAAFVLGLSAAAEAACPANFAVLKDNSASTFNMGLISDPNGNCQSYVAATLQGTLPAFAATPTVNLGTIGGVATQTTSAAILAALGSPFQAGGTIGNTSFAATQATASALNATVVGTGTFAVQLSGATNNINNIAGTISLPTGASTLAGQNVTRTPVAAGTATATNADLIGAQYLTTQPTMTNTQQASLLTSSRGELLVSPGASGFPVTLTSTTITGTVAATQSGTWNVGLSAGSNAIGSITNTTFAATQATASNLNATVVGTGTLAVQATLQASATTAIGKVDPNTIGLWGLAASTQNGTTPTNGALMMGQFNTTPTTITSGNVSPFQLDANGNLLVNVKVGGGGGSSGAVFGPTAVGSANANPPVVIGGTTTGAAGQNVVGAAVKLGSTASLATDTSLVTNESPNSQISVAVGTAADAPCTLPATTTACSQVALAKATANVANGAVAAGTNIIGKVGIDQTTPGTTNGVQVVAALPAGTSIVGKFGIDQTTPGTTNGVAPATASSWGIGAIASAVPANAHYLSGAARSSEPSAATTGNLTGGMFDLVGKQVTSPYSNRENQARASGSSTTTSAITLMAAAGAGIKNYVTDLSCTRSDAGTSAITVTLNDSSSMPIDIPNNGGGGGYTHTFNTPLVTSANTALTATPSSGVSTLHCTATGFTGY
jgi:hypothetical protein